MTTFQKYTNLVKEDIKKVHNFFKLDIWNKLRVLTGNKYIAALILVGSIYLIVMYFTCILSLCLRATHAAVDTAVQHKYVGAGASKKK